MRQKHQSVRPLQHSAHSVSLILRRVPAIAPGKSCADANVEEWSWWQFGRAAELQHVVDQWIVDIAGHVGCKNAANRAFGDADAVLAKRGVNILGDLPKTRSAIA